MGPMAVVDCCGTAGDTERAFGFVANLRNPVGLMFDLCAYFRADTECRAASGPCRGDSFPGHVRVLLTSMLGSLRSRGRGADEGFAPRRGVRR